MSLPGNCTPFSDSSTAKNPPPPNPETVRMKGWYRSQKAKRRYMGVSQNGTYSPAPRLRFCMVMTPRPTVGMPSE